MSIIIPANSAAGGGYDVANSCRFNSGSSDYLTRTPSSATNQDLWSLSFWIKRSNLGSYQSIYGVYANSTNQETLAFDDSDRLYWQLYQSSAVKGQLTTNRVFRDVSAFYNILIVYDSANGTAGNRMRMYINGVEETSFATDTNPSSGQDSQWNSTTAHTIGRINTTNYINGYISELVAVDGTALSPTDVGEFDEDSGIWKPKSVSGLTFGTNGFYLDFENSGALGADLSGNSNNFTVNNLTAIDQSTDTCTNNFATWNSLDQYYFWGAAASTNITNGNTIVQSGNSQYAYIPTTIGVNSGKYYWEIKPSARTGGTGDLLVGVTSTQSVSTGQTLGYHPNDVAYRENGKKKINNSDTDYGNSYTLNDIIGVAMDLDNNKLYFSKNGTWQNSGNPESGATGTGAISLTASASTGLGNYFASVAYVSGSYNATFQANFGSPAFAISSGNADGNGYGNFEYAVPSGYLSLNTKNLSEVLS